MKKLLAVSALMVFSSTLALAQSTPPTATDPNTSTTRYDGERRQNLGWLGLLGLLGMAGMRRPKSEFQRNMESKGIRTETVR